MPHLQHVSSVRNRNSIRWFGLDWTRMGSAPGIAGSRRPEVEGIFLCIDPGDADWFVRLNNTGGPVDVWAVEGIALEQLRISPEGLHYFPGKIASQQVCLVRQDLYHGSDTDQHDADSHSAPSSQPPITLTRRWHARSCAAADSLQHIDGLPDLAAIRALHSVTARRAAGART